MMWSKLNKKLPIRRGNLILFIYYGNTIKLYSELETLYFNSLTVINLLLVIIFN